MLTIALLLISNVFMTFAWYGHLKHKSAPLVATILVSWSIAFLEYCFMVPANRIGSNTFTTTQLKVIQEVITLIVFTVFSLLYLKDRVEERDEFDEGEKSEMDPDEFTINRRRWPTKR